MYRKKLSTSIFLIIIFTTIVVFSNFLTFSIESTIKDEKLVNDFLGSDAIWFKILPQKSIESWPQGLFNSEYEYTISKPLDATGSLTGIFFSGEIDITPEMEEGRFFNENDFLGDEKLVVIGRNLLERTKIKNEKRFYEIEGSDYEVIGVIKYRKKYDWNGYKSYINLKSITEDKDFLWVGEFGIDAGSKTSLVHSKLKTQIEKEKFVLKDSPKDVINSPFIRIVQNTKFIILMFGIILLVFILNTVSVTSYWIDSKMLEIGVKKCCGATSIDVAYDILKELLKIMIISFSIGTIIYIVLSFIMSRSLQVYINSLIGSFMIIFLSAIITSIIPILKASRVEPVSIMR